MQLEFYGSGRGGGWQFAGVCVSLAVRCLLVTCAVIDTNEATDAPPYLVYTSGSSIYRVNADGSSSEVVLSSQGAVNKLGIDFDYQNSRLFWVDSTQLRIMSSSLSGANIQTIASSGFRTLERLAYDWVTDKLYWSDYGAAQIGIVDLRTSSRTRIVLLETGPQQLSRPRALALDPKRRNMYWIDWLDETGTALIEKASMDGKGRQVIVDTDLGRPYDLTLDLESSKLYFIDGYRDTITSTDLDGSNRQQLHLFLTNVVPFSLVFHNGVLYWTERRMRLISKLTVNEETRQLGNVSVMSVRPAGLVMIAADRQPELENPCSSSGCSHICILSSNNSRGFTCACEEGVELLEDQLTCKGTVTVAPTTTLQSSTVILSPPTSAILLVPSSIPVVSPTSVTPKPCPCMNGGVCDPQQESKLHCTCPDDYKGHLCEKHIDNAGVCDVALKPICENGGTCVNTGVYEYECYCIPGYEGRNCEKRINYGICNETKPCYNGGVCFNLEEEVPGYMCKCPKGFTGDNCTFGRLEGTEEEAISSVVFVGVVVGFMTVVVVLVSVIICVFAMFKKQKEKNKALEGSASSRSNSPMIKTKRLMYRSEETPSSTDTASHEFWLQSSQPSIIRGQANLYSQGPRRAPPNLRTYAKADSFDELSRESKVLTV